MDSETQPTNLGPWANADLRGTIRASGGLGADADLPKPARFIGGVAKLIQRRLAEQGTVTDPARPAIFLLEPTARTHNPSIAPKREPMLDNGLTRVTGRLWFVNAIAASGKYIDLDDCDDDELFLTVTDRLGLGHVPAILFDPRPSIPQVRFYADGLSDPDKYESIDIANADISLTRIFEAIQRVYENCLITPEAQTKVGKIWENEVKRWPAKNAGDIVQLSVKAGLATAFPTCTIRHETSGHLGIRIEEIDPLDRARITRYAV